MTQLPSLDPIPADIEDHLKRLLRRPPDPALGDWLLELIKFSGHMSTGDDMRWRLFCAVWLTMEYDIEAGWPYLQWLNLGEPTLSTHTSEMLIEAIDNLEAHVPMANWLATVEDERLENFFRDFYPIPAQRKLPRLVARLLAEPDRPEVGVWLDMFCQGTALNKSQTMRPWRLLAAAWFAAQFNPEKGMEYLRLLVGNVDRLPAADNQRLMEAAREANGLTAMIQMIADCPDASVRTMLQEVGHPDLAALANSILESKPDYGHLSGTAEQAATDAEMFERNWMTLKQSGIDPASAQILDLACGPLAQHTLLLSSAGYDVVGADLEIPPNYLPLAGFMQWFKRRSHRKAWQEATADYFQALAEQTGLTLHWKNAAIQLADLTRLEAADQSFAAVVCMNHLHHAPDVNGLLKEAARVLRPGGLFVANIRPYSSLTGALQFDPEAPWGHLRKTVPFDSVPPFPLNKWREAQFKQALEQPFELEQWLPENDSQIEQLLTPELRAELADYSEAELTRKQIYVVAKK